MNKAHVKTAHLTLTMTTTKGKIYNDGEDSLRNRILQLTCDTAKLSLSLSLSHCTPFRRRALTVRRKKNAITFWHSFFSWNISSLAIYYSLHLLILLLLLLPIFYATRKKVPPLLKFLKFFDDCLLLRII